MESDKPYILWSDKYGHACSCTLGKETALMCPKCFAMYKIKQSGSVNASSENGIDLIIHVSYHIQCSQCGESVQAVALDPPVADCISRLNKLGYKTEMCCSGHADDKINNAFIKFDRAYPFESIPDNWKSDGVFLKAMTNDSAAAIKALSDWITGMEQFIGDAV